MTRHKALFLASTLLLPACSEQERVSKRATVLPADVAQIDSMDPSGQLLSLSGFVHTPYDDGYLVLDDGTGRIVIVLPESLDLRVGRRLLVEGTLADLEGSPAIFAEVWLYDSTGTPVNSR